MNMKHWSFLVSLLSLVPVSLAISDDSVRLFKRQAISSTSRSSPSPSPPPVSPTNTNTGTSPSVTPSPPPTNTNTVPSTEIPPSPPPASSPPIRSTSNSPIIITTTSNNQVITSTRTIDPVVPTNTNNPARPDPTSDTNASPSPSPSTDAAASTSGSSSIGTAAIVGIVVAVFSIVFGVAGFILIRWKQSQAAFEKDIPLSSVTGEMGGSVAGSPNGNSRLSVLNSIGLGSLTARRSPRPPSPSPSPAISTIAAVAPNTTATLNSNASHFGLPTTDPSMTTAAYYQYTVPQTPPLGMTQAQQMQQQAMYDPNMTLMSSTSDQGQGYYMYSTQPLAQPVPMYATPQGQEAMGHMETTYMSTPSQYQSFPASQQ